MREVLLRQLNDKPYQVSSFILNHYGELGLSSDEFIVFLHFSNGVTNMQHIARCMQRSDLEMLEIMQQLVNKQLVRDEQMTLADGKIDIHYSFEPLYQKVVTMLLQVPQEVKIEPSITFEQLTHMFEQEFGRALTPMQLTMLHDWIKIDDYSPDLIMVALKEAVLANVYHLNYIRTILDNWKQKGILTVQEAESQAQKYRKQKTSQLQETVDKNVFSEETINWFR